MTTPGVVHRRLNTRARWGLGALAWVLFTAAIPLVFTTSFHLGLAINVGIEAMLALGLMLVVGYAGQFSLAQAAFAAVGAYGSGLLTLRFGLPPLIALILSASAAALLAYITGRPILRLRGHYLAMGTLALNSIIFLLLTNWQYAGGSSGFGGIQPFSVLGFEFRSQQAQAYLVWLTVGVGLWAALWIGRTREGRALLSLRSREVAASTTGVNLAQSKTNVFVLGAAYGSIAGSLYAHVFQYVNPSPFGVLESVEVLVIVVVGGLLSPWGALVGAAALAFFREASTQVMPALMGEGAVGAGEELAVGALLAVALILMPDGIVGRLQSYLRGRRRRHRSQEGSEEAAGPFLQEPAKTPREAVRPRGEVVLQATGLTKRFGGVTAVNDVDLELHEHEILGVIGPNGAGKSTLINLLSGVLPATRGKVLLRGEDITDCAPHEVAGRGLARTFQTPSIFEDMSVEDIATIGTYLRGSAGLLRGAVPTPGVIRQERILHGYAEEALRRCGLWHLKDEEASILPLGYQKVLELSRALARGPAVLLLDEPAAGLNRAEKQRLTGLLRDIRADGVALLLIEHDMEMVMELADRVHVLDFGVTLRVGTPDEVRSDSAVIDAYLGIGNDEEASDVRA